MRRFGGSLALVLALCVAACAAPAQDVEAAMPTRTPTATPTSYQFPTPTPYPAGYTLTVRHSDNTQTTYAVGGLYRVVQLTDSSISVSWRGPDGLSRNLVLPDSVSLSLSP